MPVQSGVLQSTPLGGYISIGRTSVPLPLYGNESGVLCHVHSYMCIPKKKRGY